jgi:hypothetical protein
MMDILSSVADFCTGHCDLGMRFFALHAYTRMIGYVCLPECPVEARIEEVLALPHLICT